MCVSLKFTSHSVHMWHSVPLRCALCSEHIGASQVYILGHAIYAWGSLCGKWHFHNLFERRNTMNQLLLLSSSGIYLTNPTCPVVFKSYHQGDHNTNCVVLSCATWELKFEEKQRKIAVEILMIRTLVCLTCELSTFSRTDGEVFNFNRRAEPFDLFRFNYEFFLELPNARQVSVGSYFIFNRDNWIRVTVWSGGGKMK